MSPNTVTFSSYESNIRCFGAKKTHHQFKPGNSKVDWKRRSNLCWWKKSSTTCYLWKPMEKWDILHINCRIPSISWFSWWVKFPGQVAQWPLRCCLHLEWAERGDLVWFCLTTVSNVFFFLIWYVVAFGKDVVLFVLYVCTSYIRYIYITFIYPMNVHF